MEIGKTERNGRIEKRGIFCCERNRMIYTGGVLGSNPGQWLLYDAFCIGDYIASNEWMIEK
jgi:hypothetical protein